MRSAVACLICLVLSAGCTPIQQAADSDLPETPVETTAVTDATEVPATSTTSTQPSTTTTTAVPTSSEPRPGDFLNMPCFSFRVYDQHRSGLGEGDHWWCGGTGYLESVDTGRRTVVFDLGQVIGNGPDESYGWSFLNENPRLRTLPVRHDAEIRIRIPSAGEPEGCVFSEPGHCLSMIDELAAVVGADVRLPTDNDRGTADPGRKLWHVFVAPESGEVVWIEEWWQP